MAVESVERLTKDLKEASRTLTSAEARYLVDAYYSMQKQRVRAANQIRALSQSGEPHEVIRWFEANADLLEAQVKRALDAYSNASPIGLWAKSIYGIGPVITAGLLAHIDVERAPTVGHIWRFGGYDPTVKWEAGERRPWNAALKTLYWKIGESFKKFSGRPECFYGLVYVERKRQEVERNEAGVFAGQAAATLAARPRHKQKAIYAAGKLPDGRLDLRAMRYAVKLFLAHYHHVAYEVHYKTPPPKPYVIEHMGHVGYIAPPGWPMK